MMEIGHCILAPAALFVEKGPWHFYMHQNQSIFGGDEKNLHPSWK
jgi:hypothetical protein